MPMGCVACVLLIQRNTSPKGSETGRKIGEKNGDARFFCTNCERPEGTAFRIVHPNRPKTESPDFATGSATSEKHGNRSTSYLQWEAANEDLFLHFETIQRRNQARAGASPSERTCSMSAEQDRLDEARLHKALWKKWGPYLSERQWGTVREDYSDNGNAWDYFSHDQARSRAYRWGEDGLAGISDDGQRLCFALALWNGKDPIIKERLFGLTNSEGNHGEDVKEYYFYLDSTPTHSYMKYLYKYPQAAFPYDSLVKTNRSRGRTEPEYDLLDTGVFDDDRYFDVFVEYAKESPEDILIQIT